MLSEMIVEVVFGHEHYHSVLPPLILPPVIYLLEPNQTKSPYPTRFQ